MNNIEALKQFLNQSDPKQVALVGLNALAVLSKLMGQSEFTAFIKDAAMQADRTHSGVMGEIRKLSQDDVNSFIRAGAVKFAERVDDNTARIFGHDDKPIGLFKTSAPFLRDTGGK
jgi:hypothetical protein